MLRAQSSNVATAVSNKKKGIKHKTAYFCVPSVFFPQYESVITPGNEAIVHHMEVFECAPEISEVPDYNGSCDDKMKPKKLNFCRHVLAAWAMGAEVRREADAHTQPLTAAHMSHTQMKIWLILT